MDVISDKLAVAVATKLTPGVFSRVTVGPAIDSDGLDAWAVMVVLNSEDVTGDQALQTIVAVQETFEKHGDNSIAIIRFATEDDLKVDVGSEV